ncbi:DNA-formamidopyrimidine glycosylase [candidate division WWE3 bacterium RIFCSPHIGHO2_01_FULL_48_15]|uniref:DNA-formamidopyrimidine glycosylase n=1 Tax=candidate division WWE3 bacterium RIFCSPHIGHO2_01_FULL_48_15 TaxID=1802619 RepID=A0A1F4VBB2_UNCKA|nr:MAG: DNA-formamidopyrimidine glycosylase [candidate division WWE3 bacterium RIFCSPHIGHO2_01_FULL_48_15]
MPELPEVETIRRDLDKELRGLTFKSVETTTPKMVRPTPAEFEKALKGQKFLAVARRAKLLIFELEHNKFVVHLRLTGRLLLCKIGDPPDEFQRVVFKLSGRELRFADLRKFGYAKLLKSDDELEKLLAQFGPEPFDDLTKEKFKEILAKSGRRVKDVLMDQEKISGLGNIYANDALWLAKIHPQSKSSKITPKQAGDLYQAIVEILEKSIKLRGASDRPGYRDIYGQKGSYQDHFLTYQKTGKPCPRGDGIIERRNVNGRGTFFCPKCQVLVK